MFIAICLFVVAAACSLGVIVSIAEEEGGPALFWLVLTVALVAGGVAALPDKDNTQQQNNQQTKQVEFCTGSPEEVTFCNTPGNISERVRNLYKTFPEAIAAEAYLKTKMKNYHDSLNPPDNIPPPLPNMNSYDAQMRRSDSILNAKLRTP